MTMKKRLLIGGTMVAVALTLGVGALSASGAGPLTAPGKEITIDGKKPAHFSHPTHMKLGLACGTCHHDGEHKPLTAEAIAVLPDAKQLNCASCHNSTFRNKDLQTPKEVFHARCKECHKVGYAGKTGPTGCVDCHIKQAKKAVEGC
jgi:hypothetical protein